MELTAKLLADLLGALRSSAGAELNKRKHPRVGLRVKTDIWHTTLGRMTVWVRDLSAGGANLAVPMQMTVGDDLQILLTHADADDDKIGCKVMHCRKVAPGMFSVGVKFDNPPIK